MEPMDDRYATFREHAELRERAATIEATMQQLAPALARIETLITARTTPQVDHSALATHRVLDDLPQIIESLRSKTNNSSPVPVLIAFAIVGAMAIGVLGYKFITGG